MNGQISETLRTQGWVVSCDCEHDIKPHSHSQMLIEGCSQPECQNCGKETHFDAHVFENEFGKNNCMLRSVFYCDHCKQYTDEILYEGVSRDLDYLLHNEV